MSLKEQLRLDMADAMRSGDKEKRDTLRLLLSAVKQVEIDEQVDLENDDEAVLAVLNKQAKQRRESIDEYAAAGRADLVDEEKAQLVLIESYLPAQMDRYEITLLAQGVIEATGASGPKDTGMVMGQLMPKVKGKADGRLVNEVVRELLKG
ncbi:MAG: GatB/YqeY domain-containing protein [Candidatus Promineifilaceae bacterium]